jgi:Uma2 family endonuclease
MATQPVPEFEEPFMTVEEYLHTVYSPDCDYVDGRLEDRNAGEYDHGYLQTLLGTLFTINSTVWGVRTVTAVRMQVSRSHFRVPDLAVLRADGPRERILTHPPLIVIEILSPEDRLSRFHDKLDDYLAFGVENIWVLDPERRVARTALNGELHIVRSGELTVPETPIRVVLSDLFAELDRT